MYSNYDCLSYFHYFKLYPLISSAVSSFYYFFQAFLEYFCYTDSQNDDVNSKEGDSGGKKAKNHSQKVISLSKQISSTMDASDHAYYCLWGFYLILSSGRSRDNSINCCRKYRNNDNTSIYFKH